MLNGSPMDSSAPDRSFGGVSFVTRTGDRKSKSGVVLLRAFDGEPDGVLTNKPKKLMLKVDRQELGIFSKDGKTILQSIPVAGCTFKLSETESGTIDAVCPNLKFTIKHKDTQSWLLCLQTNSTKTGLSGAPGALIKRKDSLGFILNEPPKPHLANRKSIEMTVSKPKGSSMGMKVCGGGGPDGDPERPEIFVFSLESGGLASEAGLARGDIVISVDRVPLTGLHVSQAAQELSKSGGSAIKLVILRKMKKHASRVDAAGVGNFSGEAEPPKPAAVASTKTPSKRDKEKEAKAEKPKKESKTGKAPAKTAEVAKDSAKKAKAKSKTKPKRGSKDKTGAAATATAADSQPNNPSPDAEEDFGFSGLESPTPDDIANGEDAFGFGDEAKPKPARAAPPPPAAPATPPASPTTSIASPMSPASPDSTASTPTSEARAARLAKMRASRANKKTDWLADLYLSLKIIDDLAE
eukprot:m.311960 g.311960  ORF g.311960 m.311960 type:complete len:467 (-) comp27456_c0_seq1:407-1807(-)